MQSEDPGLTNGLVSPPTEPQAPVDREVLLVQALRDYLTEIEGAQKTLLEISRRALKAAIAELGPDADVAPGPPS